MQPSSSDAFPICGKKKSQEQFHKLTLRLQDIHKRSTVASEARFDK